VRQFRNNPQSKATFSAEPLYISPLAALAVAIIRIAPLPLLQSKATFSAEPLMVSPLAALAVAIIRIAPLPLTAYLISDEEKLVSSISKISRCHGAGPFHHAGP
ncbi:hypothetical protein F5887DRAFT_924982, partial [Amanita rubescens]